VGGGKDRLTGKGKKQGRENPENPTFHRAEMGGESGSGREKRIQNTAPHPSPTYYGKKSGKLDLGAGPRPFRRGIRWGPRQEGGNPPFDKCFPTEGTEKSLFPGVHLSRKSKRKNRRGEIHTQNKEAYAHGSQFD